MLDTMAEPEFTMLDKEIKIEKLQKRIEELESLIEDAVLDDWFIQNNKEFEKRWQKALEKSL